MDKEGGKSNGREGMEGEGKRKVGKGGGMNCRHC